MSIDDRPGSASRTYHRLTSYSPERPWDKPVDDPRVLQGFIPNDRSRIVPPVKRYAGTLPTTPLPRDLAPITTDATAVLAGSVPGTTHPLDLASLGRVLYLAAGVVRVSDLPDGRRILFRAAGSAGARFPLELYVAATGVQGLADGVHWYDPVEHALRQVGPPAAQGGTTVVVTGVPWRTGWRYAERGYRHIFWDAGTMLAQLLAVAGSAGLPARLWPRFPDAGVTALVGADGVHEFPVALVTLTPGEPATAGTGPATAGSIDDEPLEFPLVTATVHAGDAAELGPPEPLAAPLDGDAPASPPLDEVILRRGSTRRMRRDASVPRAVFEFAMRAAVRGVPEPQFVAVHAVDGVRPGLYRWPDLDHPRREGDLRDVMTDLCLGQHLGGEAAFVVLSCADVEQLDDRGYRAAQLRAGIVEGRLHLAAYALGAGASGMTFYDGETTALLGEPLQPMLFTCVGVPEYTNRAGGPPAAPSSVRVITPRTTDE